MSERSRLSTDSSPKLQIPYQKLDNARWKKSHILAWEGKKLHLVVLVSSIKGRKNRTMNSVPLFFFFFFREIPYPRKVSFSRDNIYSTRPNIFSIIIYTRLLIFNVFFFLFYISVYDDDWRKCIKRVSWEKILKSEFNYFIFKGLIILLKS